MGAELCKPCTDSGSQPSPFHAALQHKTLFYHHSMCSAVKENSFRQELTSKSHTHIPPMKSEGSTKKEDSAL